MGLIEPPIEQTPAVASTETTDAIATGLPTAIAHGHHEIGGEGKGSSLHAGGLPSYGHDLTSGKLGEEL